MHFFLYVAKQIFHAALRTNPRARKNTKGFHSMKVLVVATLVAVSALAEANIDGKFAER